MLSFKIEKDENKWHSFCEELPGCHSFGNTPEEAMYNLKNALQLYIEDEIEQQCLQHMIQTKKSIAYV
jgi:predicted RNase H-like HicB family nuclease